MRRALWLALAAWALLLADSSDAATCTAVTGTWGTGISAGTALSDSPDTDCQAPFTINDTLQIPSGVTVTIAASSTVNFSTGAGNIQIDDGGALVVNGVLKLYNDLTTMNGTLTVTGDLKMCLSGDGTCAIAGDTGTAFTLSSWDGYNLNTTYYQITAGNTLGGGAGTDWDSVDAAIDDNAVLAWTDIDGNPSNDSPGGSVRMFFNLYSGAIASNDGIRLTYGVGSSSPGSSAYDTEELEDYGAGACAGADLNLDGTPDSAFSDAVDGDSDGIQTDQTMSVLERDTTVSLPSTALAQNGDYVGQYLCLNVASGNTPCYLIWKTIDGGGATRDTARIWPPLVSNDHTASARRCFISWGEGGGTYNTLGLGANEFIVFQPARIIGNRAGVDITVGATGHFVPTFAVIGAVDGEAGFGPTIQYTDTSASYNDTWRYVWQVGVSRNIGTDTCDGMGVQILGGDGTNLTFDHVRTTHSFEPRYGTSCTNDPDYTSGAHGYGFMGAGTLNFYDSGCFSTGDACLFDLSSGGSGTAGRINLRNFVAGWIAGVSSAAIKMGNAGETMDVDGLYTARVTSRVAQCFGNGSQPGADASANQGASCTSDADCGGVVGTCLTAAAATVRPSVGGINIRNWIGFGKVDEGAYFKGDTTMQNLHSIDGGFFLDARPNGSVVSDEPAMFYNIASVRHTSSPFSGAISVESSGISSVYSENFVGRLVENWMSSSQTLLVGCQDDAAAALSFPCRVENNVFLSLQDNGVDFLKIYDTGANSPPDGAKLRINNNFVNRENAATTNYFFNAGSDWDTATNDLQIKGNVVTGYRSIGDCDAGFDEATNPVEATGNILSKSTAAGSANSVINPNCVINGGLTDFANMLTSRPFMMAMNGVRIGNGSGTVSGPRITAGYAQSPWLNRFRIPSWWVPGPSGSTIYRTYPRAVLP